jgi:uncharacterized protein
MLLIKTRVDKSAIHGLGLFAAEPIAANKPIWRFTPGFDLELDPSVLESQPDILRECLLHYGYIDPKLNRYILCCDDARFINHSNTPNIRTDYSLDRFGVDLALREIRIGDELTIDYESIEGTRPTSFKPA